VEIPYYFISVRNDLITHVELSIRFCSFAASSKQAMKTKEDSKHVIESTRFGSCYLRCIIYLRMICSIYCCILHSHACFRPICSIIQMSPLPVRFGNPTYLFSKHETFLKTRLAFETESLPGFNVWCQTSSVSPNDRPATHQSILAS
jgi:hypothetical protein